MNLTSPVFDVVPSVRGALLQSLAGFERAVTRRQLAAAAGVAPGNASGVVEDLIDAGIVIETIAGRASMVELNREHLAAAPVIALAQLRGELIRRLRDELRSWPHLHGAWLFGSVARADAGRRSDIDVLVVADDLESENFHDRYTSLDRGIHAWTGNELQLVEYTPERWRRLMRSKNPLVDEVRRDGIALAGSTSELLRRRPRATTSTSSEP